MFVQSSHFIEHEGLDTMKRVTFYGQEKTATTIRLAKMNLAVHGLEGDIARPTPSTTTCTACKTAARCGATDFVMANPPFNVDMVDAEKVKDDRRLPFGLPGVNKDKKVSNGNYLWISYFWSYLSTKGPRRLRHVLPGQQRRPRRERRCAASWWKPATWM
jgi:type I restriction enzyme M protein